MLIKKKWKNKEELKRVRDKLQWREYISKKEKHNLERFDIIIESQLMSLFSQYLTWIS